jgi:hypothetical protein
METKKRLITKKTAEEVKITLKVPVSLIQSFEKETGEGFINTCSSPCTTTGFLKLS